MGRLRNISASFKAAAFPSSSGNTSPVTSSRPTDHGEIKNVPALARETSANSTTSIPNGNRMIRPGSMIFNAPTLVGGRDDDVDELKPVFSFLSSHSNKLYQEGYFLKLDDLDTHGKPNANRNWTECFAQLVGTILSLWDAAALDNAGQDGEVAPSFINLADASIKMIETLPTRNQDVQPLQNVLSVSTAGKNRYLLHFNSLHSLTQWTAGIRLAMFENASLQELYTGSLIAGKGRQLNNINQIMTKSRFRTEDWVRVRFGAGTPWRRCWCVVEPPDEKEWQKSNKRMGKRSAYDRPVYPKGDIKFFDTKKIKKAVPIATITDAYSAYAIYPQSKPLINESTLVKLEGKITIHSNPESKTEGFVFVMPEVHPAVTGFEMLLRWLLPVYDTFSLYGRPTRLIPDTLDTRSLMFAMPRERKYGYLDIIDIAALIHTEGSDKWSEREWRKRMKDATAKRISMQGQGKSQTVRDRPNAAARPGIQFSDSGSDGSVHSHKHNQSTDAVFEGPKKTLTAPAVIAHNYHARSVSETGALAARSRQKPRDFTPSRLSEEQAERMDVSPAPPIQRHPLNPQLNEAQFVGSANSSDSDIQPQVDPEDVNRDMAENRPVQPVAAPPSFSHQANDQPRKRPVDRPEMRREKSRMSNATLTQMVEANKQSGISDAGAAAAAAWRQNGDQTRGVNDTPVEDDRNPTKRPAVLSKFRTNSDKSITRKPVPPQSRSPLPVTTTDTESDMSRLGDWDLQNSKIRGGIRKTVGDPDIEEKRKSDIPEIDFGVTERLTPGNSRPGTAGGHRSPLEHSRPNTSGGRLSPFESVTPVSAPGAVGGRDSPVTPISAPRTPDGPSPNHSRSGSQAWHPGAVAGSRSPGGLTAEEFVAQRAASANRPHWYSPGRTQSSGKIEQLKVEEQRPGSPKRLQKKSPKNVSGASSQDFSSHLSAREQEHVARITGGPLVNLGERNRVPDPSVGLIGAISNREQEKKNLKDGVQGQMVQAAIDQRQREVRTYQMHQANTQYPQMGNPWGQQYMQGYPAQQFPQNYGMPYQQQFPPQQMPQGQPPPPPPQQQQQQQQPNQRQYSGYYAPQGR